MFYSSNAMLADPTIKHPSLLFTLYADIEQMPFGIIWIPLMTHLTLRLVDLPMGFYDSWRAQTHLCL